MFIGSVLFVAVNCKSSMMRNAEKRLEPDRNFSVITFFRPAVFFGDGVKFSLWDGENFIGIMTAGNYIQYMAKPGKHLFMALGGKGSALKADIAPGKNYYVAGRVIPGAFKGHLRLFPANIDEIDKINTWFEEMTQIEMVPEKGNIYSKRMESRVKTAIKKFNEPGADYAVMGASEGIPSKK